MRLTASTVALVLMFQTVLAALVFPIVNAEDVVDATAPTVSITSPVESTTVSGTVAVTVDAADDVGVVGVQFLLDGVSLNPENLVVPFTMNWDTAGTANGNHTLGAVARDQSGKSGFAVVLNFMVSNAPPPDTTAPTVTITQPTDAATLIGGVTLAADATDNTGVVGVQFKLDGSPLGAEVAAPPYTYSWPTSGVGDGSHAISAMARDAAGNSAPSSDVHITVHNVDTAPPTVAISQPTEGATVSGTVEVRANAADDIGVTKVRFKLDGAYFGPTDTTVPFTLNWNTNESGNRSHTLIAQAYDAVGNATLSTSVHVIVNNGSGQATADTISPTVGLTAPGADTTLTGVATVSADAADNIGLAGVQFFLDGFALSPEVTAPPFTFQWDTTSAQYGYHTLAAVARDQFGNITTASQPVSVSNSIPSNPSGCPGAPTCGGSGDVNNNNNAIITNNAKTFVNSGRNISSGFDTPHTVMIGTGAVSADNVVSNQVNSNLVTVNGQETVLPSDPSSQPLDNLIVNNNNNAKVVNNLNSMVESGKNQANQNRYSTTTTGAANVFTAVVNSVNTNLTGTNLNAQVKNIVEPYVGSINFLDMMMELFSAGHGTLPGNLEVNNNNNGAIDNNILINASTGGNVSNDNRQTTIATGKINVATSVVNLLNTNVIGSNWLFSVINVFGNFTGDIILPGEGVLASLYNTQPGTVTVNASNNATVNNSVQVLGDTGSNTTNYNGNGQQVQTGNTQLQTAVISAANRNVVGSNFFNFVPHIFGSWQGSVINNPWNGYFGGDVTNTNGTLDAELTNNAAISNNVKINATSGGNTSNGNRYTAYVTTGNVRVATNIMNVANTNLVGSNWFLGNFNMFGSWTGNIIYAYPDLAVSLANANTPTPGSQLTYDLSVENLGLAPAQNPVMTETLPAHTSFVSASDNGIFENGKVVWDLGQMPANSPKKILHVTVQVDNGLPVGDTGLLTTASVATPTPESEMANNSVSTTLTVNVPAPTPSPAPAPVAVPGMVITKSNNAAGPVKPGDTIEYSVDVANTGNVPLQSIAVHDVLRALSAAALYEKDFYLEELPVDSTMHVTYSLVVSSDTKNGTYTNVATATATYGGATITAGESRSSVVVIVSAAAPGSPLTNNSSSGSAWQPATAPNGQTVSSPVKLATVKNQKLKVKQTISVKKSVKAGGSIKYKISTYNPNSYTVNNATVTNTLVNGQRHVMRWKIGKMKPREEIIISFTFILAKTAPPGKYSTTSTALGYLSNGKKVASNSAAAKFAVTGSPVKKNAITKSVASVSKTVSQKVVNSGLSSKSSLKGSATRTATNGFFFRDEKGSPISPDEFARLNGMTLVDVLRQSGDPTDIAFVRAYEGGLSLVGQRGKTGTVITQDDILNDLRRSPKFKPIFGNIG